VTLLRCPFCNYEESKVIDSRPAENGTIVRRRRECIECKRRFTTYEKLESVPLVVIKKSGDRQTYDRNKILSGILKACEKRPISADTIENLLDIIEYKILTTYDKEVQSKDIGEIVIEELKKIDEIAYVRFASVYRQFKDINTFMDELKSMLGDENKENK
jgi:transcriptional repressor NrdR